MSSDLKSTNEQHALVKAFTGKIDDYFRSLQKSDDMLSAAIEISEHIFDVLCQVQPESVRAIATRYMISSHDVYQLYKTIWQFLVEKSKLGKLKKLVGLPLQTQAVQALASFANVTDYSDEMCRCLGEKGGLHMTLSDLGTEKLDKDVVSTATTLVYNCCWRVPENRDICREKIDVLQELAESTHTDIQADAFLALAYIVDKSESYRISLQVSCVKFLLSDLRCAVMKPDRRSPTLYSALELIQGLYQLSMNDGNKVMIVKLEGLDLLEKILMDGAASDEEKGWAAKAVWQLAFIEENKAMIRKRTSIIKKLETIKETAVDNSLVDACSGALFVTRDASDIAEKAVRDPEDSNAHGRTSGPSHGVGQGVEGGHHIMISYQHASQERMLRVKAYLEARGYSVWMDVDNMKGDILGAMAQAVQKAAVVLICMTRRFKDSRHCRTEATYAYTMNKDIIPLMLEEGYIPHDWLGALLGMKKYFQIFTDALMDVNLPELIKELNHRGKQDTAEIVPIRNEQLGATPPPSHQAHGALKTNDSTEATDSTDEAGEGGGHNAPVREGGRGPPLPTNEMKLDGIESWTEEQTNKWLRSNGVSLPYFKGEGEKLNGVRLVQIHGLMKLAPEFCMTSLKEELHLNFWEILSLVAALKKL